MTNIDDEFEVNVSDLTDNSNVLVVVRAIIVDVHILLSIVHIEERTKMGRTHVENVPV